MSAFSLPWEWWLPIAAAVIVLLLVVISRRYVKVGPNEVLIVSGITHKVRDLHGNKLTVGYRMVKGGGTFVIPIFERVDRLSLELFTVDVNTPEVYTRLGVPVIVDGLAQVKVRSDEDSIRVAAEQFLSKGRQEVMRIALQTLEGHLRAIIGALTVEEAYSSRDAFAGRVQEVAASDLAGMGLIIVSFTIRDIKDHQGYLESLGRPQIAKAKKDAEVGEANARRDMLILAARADQEGRTAQLEAETHIAEADRDRRMRLAEFEAAVQQKKALADFAYDLEKQKIVQQVREEELQIELIEKTRRIEIEQKEIERREKELVASVEKPAAAERYRIEQLAEAEKTRLDKIALAEAEGIRQRGIAQAEVIRHQGEAEAQAMERKASAWQRYNEAAIFETLIQKLPELARAVSEPLSKIDKIVVISSDSNGAGVSRVTQDIMKVVAQLPVVVESLTGLKLNELLQRIPHLASQPTPAASTPPAKEPPTFERKTLTIPHPKEEQA